MYAKSPGRLAFWLELSRLARKLQAGVGMTQRINDQPVAFMMLDVSR
jgi:hypothetical protein